MEARIRRFAAVRNAGTTIAEFPADVEALDAPALVVQKTLKETPMGKYFLAWLLGVPAGLLIIIYVIMHL